MHADGAEISVSAVATQAGVHRSFVHLHADLTAWRQHEMRISSLELQMGLKL
jgi:hypothetical protein